MGGALEGEIRNGRLKRKKRGIGLFAT
jgi:hypothetical protein